MDDLDPLAILGPWARSDVLIVGARDVVAFAPHVPILVQSDPFTSGPLPVRLDDAGLRCRADHWRGPHPMVDVDEREDGFAGDADLLAAVEDKTTIIVWGDGGAWVDLVRGWVCHVLNQADLDIPVHRGRWARGWPDAVDAGVDIETPATRQTDLELWHAATSPSPSDLHRLATHGSDPAKALLRWYPRADTGLHYWHHQLLEGIEHEHRPVHVIGQILKDHDFEIGDVTLADILYELATTGLAAGIGDDGEYRNWSPRRTHAAEELLDGKGRYRIQPGTQVGGVQLDEGWAVLDHETFDLSHVPPTPA